MYISKKADAKRRGISFSLTFEEFGALVAKLDLTTDRRSGIQVDRIDHTKGYEPGNVQLLHVSENTAKGNRERHMHNYRKMREQGPQDYEGVEF